MIWSHSWNSEKHEVSSTYSYDSYSQVSNSCQEMPVDWALRVFNTPSCIQRIPHHNRTITSPKVKIFQSIPTWSDRHTKWTIQDQTKPFVLKEVRMNASGLQESLEFHFYSGTTTILLVFQSIRIKSILGLLFDLSKLRWTQLLLKISSCLLSWHTNNC